MDLLICLIIIYAIVYCIKSSFYKKTEYYIQTKNSLFSVWIDKGKLGEYYTYKYLKRLEGYRRYLFNVYLPKDNGETTEVDVILIHESGIYVFESKNYSGWIFGTENQKMWTQTLPRGKGRSQKEHFFNPIMQNKVHMKWLKEYLGDINLPMYSYIVFSDRCTLKDINLTSGEHFVINRYNILKCVHAQAKQYGRRLSDLEINKIYEKLFPLTQVDETLKAEHIRAVKDKQKKQPLKVEKKVQREVIVDNTIGKKCPRCGADLIIRTSSKGEYKGERFMGCSNFPKCRYKINIVK